MQSINLVINHSWFEALLKIPKDVQKRAIKQVDQLSKDYNHPSLNFEPIYEVRDDKVYTFRITNKYRGVVIRFSNNDLMVVHVDNHDEAIGWVRNKVFEINDYSNSIQYYEAELIDPSVPTIQVIEPKNENSLYDLFSEKQFLSLGVPKPCLPALRYIYSVEDLQTNIKEYVSSNIVDILETCLLPDAKYEEVYNIFIGDEEPHNLPKGSSIKTLASKKTNKPYLIAYSNEDSINQMLGESIEKWRVFLHPIQQELVTKSFNGSALVKGAAGTGKTVVAMHRAKYLAEYVFSGSQEKILFTTYSKKLIKSINSNLSKICSQNTLEKIDVLHIHSWAAQYLSSHGIEFKIIKNRGELLGTILSEIDNEEGFRIEDIEIEIDKVISQNEITTLDDYIKVKRKGTYCRLGRNQKTKLWSILSKYYETLREQNEYEWWQIIVLARKLVNEKKDVAYAAIILDEAQDFGMVEYRLIRSLVDEKKNDIFMVGDIRQQIYAKHHNFSKCNINIKSRSKKLSRNYRNSIQINDLANHTLEDVSFYDLDDNELKNEFASSFISGKKPIILEFLNKKEEADYVIQEIRKNIDAGIELYEMAIFCRTKRYLREFFKELDEVAIRYKLIDDINFENQDQNAITLSTMHSAKGFEFKVVYMIGMNKGIIPLESAIDNLNYDKEIDDFIKMEKSLIYVSMTRARDVLYILSSSILSEYI